MKKKYFIIPVLTCLFCSLFIFTTLDKKILDLFQSSLKSTVENKNVLMVNIDDPAINNIGSWPLSRDCYADALYVLKHLGAKQAIFDLSFIDHSPAKVDETYVKETLPDYIQNDFEILKNSEDLDDGINQARESILTSVSYVIRPIDELLAQSLAFFGDSFTNITMDDTFSLPDGDVTFFNRYVALNNITSAVDTKTPEFKSLMPSLRMLVEKSKGAGFVNTIPDTDGYTRRVNLLLKHNGRYFGQLVFVPYLQLLGNPEIEVNDDYIVLKDALVNGEKRTISIPRDREGNFLLKYPKKEYVKYNSISFWNIYRIYLLEKVIESNVNAMNESGFFEYTDISPAEMYSAVSYLRNELLKGEDKELGITFENYFDYRKKFFDSLRNILSKDYESVLLNEVGDDVELSDFVKELLGEVRKNLEEFEISSKELMTIVKDSSCIFGTSATSTTDYGLNLYEEHYPNPGVHYTVLNQLLSEDFISETTPVISIVYAFILSLFMAGISVKVKGTGRQILLGLFFTILSVLSLFIFFYITHKYVPAAIPLASTLLTFVILTAVGFISESKGKKFITNAFGQCLSKEVVKEIVEHPESFKLGGQKLEMTAIFTDIQKFSSFSELLTAGELVALLNYYLTKMSDIIMEERGTVDKYEGDAIIALVGAPVKMEDHAERAVRAALNMKHSEVIMNEEIRKVAAEPMSEGFDEELYSAFTKMVKNEKSIFTRIGINSGEMIAGYMGSENKKNYTMMGNNVNLASRLEGVNKQYSTGGILISEYTKNFLNDDVFVLRKLDKVQVVNVNTPMRLYEPLGLISDSDEKLKRYAEKWDSAMELFDNGEYEQSLKIFESLVSENRSDNVLKYYIRLLSDFFVKGKYPVEEDGIGVAYNPDLKAFKMLQK